MLYVGRDHVPVIMLTAPTPTVTTSVAGLEAGADDYVTKPFTVEELLGSALNAEIRRGRELDAETTNRHTASGPSSAS